MDIDNMPAGREMDALIAEKIFNFKWYYRDGDKHPDFGWLLNPQKVIESNGHPTWPVGPLVESKLPLNHSADYPSILPYSMDITAAWQVAEKFDQGIALFRNLWANGKWYWHCHIGGSINGPGESWAEELTAPLAICRAALKFRGAIDVH